jgi:SAM-dependent methyltransferase
MEQAAFSTLLTLPRALQGRGTAWCVWDASVVLALFLASPAFDSLLSSLTATKQKQTQSLRCVELGSGTGLGGLALAARLRETASVEVVLTDLPEALPALQRNVDANPMLRGLITVAPCDWLTPPAGLTGDVVVAADCVWLSDLVTPFVNTLAQTLRHDGIALLVHQTRSVSVDDRLWAGLAKAGFTVDRQPQPPGAESAAACVYILRQQARE